MSSTASVEWVTSTSICVTSIVGRFLEHARVDYFRNTHHPLSRRISSTRKDPLEEEEEKGRQTGTDG